MGTADVSFGQLTNPSHSQLLFLKHGRTSGFLRNILHPTERGLCKLDCNSSLPNMCGVDRSAASSSLCFGAPIPVQLPGWFLRVDSDQPWSEELPVSRLGLIPERPQLSCVQQALGPVAGVKTSQGRWAGDEPGHLLPHCRSVPAAGQWGWGDAVAPQLCLCAGSAAGSVPEAVSLWLHPAVTWYRARVLGWKVLIS